MSVLRIYSELIWEYGSNFCKKMDLKVLYFARTALFFKKKIYIYLYFVLQFTLETVRSCGIRIGAQPLSMAVAGFELESANYIMFFVNTDKCLNH